MTTRLTHSNCEACRIDAPVLSDKEITNLLPEIPSWIVFDDDGIKKLVCSFAFLNYEDSVNFTNKVAQLADKEDHHPEITLEWGKVTVVWWSHKIKGLHKNDFICAAKTDQLNK
ncbi:4a-hydroxytetrahydrobiopterin dehydratase [Gammaproteobacteria bacterium]|nr:4a-hydroxytetrahydrobiopterin dehydratase [Gammaproteobacteria bacterium]